MFSLMILCSLEIEVSVVLVWEQQCGSGLYSKVSTSALFTVQMGDLLISFQVCGGGDDAVLILRVLGTLQHSENTWHQLP